MNDKLDDDGLWGHPVEFSRMVDGHVDGWKLCPHSHPLSVRNMSSKTDGRQMGRRMKNICVDEVCANFTDHRVLIYSAWYLFNFLVSK
jgi:hypothetical protein